MKKAKKLSLAILSLVCALALFVAVFAGCGGDPTTPTTPTTPGGGGETPTPVNVSLVAPDGAPMAALADMWGSEFDGATIDYAVTAEKQLNTEFASGTEFIVAPINIGANIHNSYAQGKTKYDYKLMNVTSWGVLYLITTEDYTVYEGKDAADVDAYAAQFDGKTITTIGLPAIPGKTTGYIFDGAELSGTDATVIQQSIARGDKITAVLGEPAITALKTQGKEFTVLASISDLFADKTGEEFPMAGMFVRSDIAAEHATLVTAINDKIRDSVAAFNADPEAVGTKAEGIEGCSLKGAVLKNAKDKMNVRFRNAADSKDAVNELFSHIGVTVDDAFFL